MNTFTDRLYRLSHSFVLLFSLFLTFLLFFGSFLFTCYADNMETQKVLTTWDNPLFCLPLTGIVLFAVSGCALFIVQKKSKKRKRILLLTVIGWLLFTGFVLILAGRTVPAADAMSVYSAAERLAAGDTTVIHPTDSYLSFYPQQVGLMGFLELLIRVWKLSGSTLPAYHFLKGVYVLLLSAAVFFQYKGVHLLWHSDLADCIYLLLAGLNFPMIMYSSFVYGEIPSFAAFSAGLYFLLRLFSEEKKKHRNALLSLILLTCSVMLRKNSLILIIAIVIVILLESLSRKRWQLTGFALLLILSSCSILPLVQKSYEIRSGSTLSTGVTATSYFAMGMQEAARGNGWYNGFNINTYSDAGMDADLANRISRDAIKERLAYFAAHPSYTADFYLRKQLSQWADGTYASRQATLATFGGRQSIVEAIYTGSLSRLYIGYCNIYQNVLYLGAFLFFFAQYRACRATKRFFPTEHDFLTHKKRETVPTVTGLIPYIGIIGVIGGFLFHLLWEANSRYILIYGLLLMPYAARGLCNISRLIFPNQLFSKAHESAPH